MEYADGGDLASLIEAKKSKGQRFPEKPDVAKLLLQCCEALAHCHHELHLLHRDIKPANIFLTSRGDVKIGDFGISRSVSGSTAMALTKCGSPLYMSPELCEGRPYDRGCDVWALGCSIYQMCSLKEPFLDQMEPSARRGMMGLMRTICTQSLDLDSLDADYSAGLRGTLSWMLTRESASRPSFREVLASSWVQSLAADKDVPLERSVSSGTTGSRSPARSNHGSTLSDEALSTHALLALGTEAHVCAPAGRRLWMRGCATAAPP